MNANALLSSIENDQPKSAPTAANITKIKVGENANDFSPVRSSIQLDEGRQLRTKQNDGIYQKKPKVEL